MRTKILLHFGRSFVDVYGQIANGKISKHITIMDDIFMKFELMGVPYYKKKAEKIKLLFWHKEEFVLHLIACIPIYKCANNIIFSSFEKLSQKTGIGRKRRHKLCRNNHRCQISVCYANALCFLYALHDHYRELTDDP